MTRALVMVVHVLDPHHHVVAARRAAAPLHHDDRALGDGELHTVGSDSHTLCESEYVAEPCAGLGHVVVVELGDHGGPGHGAVHEHASLLAAAQGACVGTSTQPSGTVVGHQLGSGAQVAQR